MNKDSFIYVVIFTFVTAFLFVFIIALADNATAERVAQNRQLVTAEAFLNAIGEAEMDSVKVLEKFKQLFGEVNDDEVVRTQVNNQDLLVKQFQGDGLWGTVIGVLAVDSSVSRIIGLDIISHNETPGLGGRIEEDWFKNQFRNEKIDSYGIQVRKGEGSVDSDPDNSMVDGVTGASLTSASMEVMVNNEINLFKEASR